MQKKPHPYLGEMKNTRSRTIQLRRRGGRAEVAGSSFMPGTLFLTIAGSIISALTATRFVNCPDTFADGKP
jgi:hypothetical protein